MDKAIFRESDHSYWLGEKQLISVTQLLKKHGLSTDYGAINPEILQAKAARGTHVHKEIEDYIKTGETGFTKEFSDFVEIAEGIKLVSLESEVIINDDLVAGTADLMGTDYDGVRVLADIKTSASADKSAWAWQLSLYERISGETFGRLLVLHLGENSKVIEVERIAAEEVSRLLECERNGEIYQKAGLVISADIIAAAEAAEAELARAETAAKLAKETAEQYREALYAAMGEQQIKSWETLNGRMLITRVEPTTKTNIDSARLKKDLPDVAAKYAKTSNVKGYVKITLREE